MVCTFTFLLTMAPLLMPSIASHPSNLAQCDV
jgi:hypothetical protein